MYILVSLFFVRGTPIELAIILAVKRIKCALWLDTKLHQNTRTSTSNSRNLDEARSDMTYTPETRRNSWLYNSESNVNYKSCKRRILSTTRTTNKIDFSAFCFFLFIHVTFTCIYLFYTKHLTYVALYIYA